MRPLYGADNLLASRPHGRAFWVVPTESLAAVLQELGIPHETTSEIVLVPPFTIELVPTAQPLVIDP